MKHTKPIPGAYAVLAFGIVTALHALSWAASRLLGFHGPVPFSFGLGEQAGMPQQFPDLNTFRSRLAAVNPGTEWEVIKQSLYDTAIYPLAGTVGLNFFQQPIGGPNSAQPGNAGNAKSLRDTNMTQAGILPAPQMFFVSSIEVDFQPGSVTTANNYALRAPYTATNTLAGALAGVSINDMNTFYSTGSLTFTIGTKQYLQEAPLLRFPPKARFELDGSIAEANSTVNITVSAALAKMRAGGRPYQLDPGIAIFSMQNFAVQLGWDTVQAMTTNNAQVRVILDGWLFRAIQ